MAGQANSQANVSLERELSLLALKAAMQIDAIRRKETVASDYVAQLTERLKGGWDDRPTADHVKELAPPATGVMQRAIYAFSGKQLQSNEDLAGGITDLLAKLDAPL